MRFAWRTVRLEALKYLRVMRLPATRRALRNVVSLARHNASDFESATFVAFEGEQVAGGVFCLDAK